MATGELMVLGGSGFLGAQVLCAASQRVPAVCASRKRPPAGAAHCERLAWSASQTRGLEEFLERPGLQAVILCAGLTRGADCEARPAEARALNQDLPERVAAGCARRGLRFVHISSDLVFGNAVAPPGGFRPQDPPQPRGVYGETKRAGELAVLGAHPRAVVARLPLLFGDSLGRGLGASDSLLASLERGESPGLFQDEFRTPLDVVEAAAALVELALGEARGLWHIAGPVRLSRFALGELALEAAGWDPASGWPKSTSRAQHASSSPRPADACLDASRARAELASPLSSPRQALRARPPGTAKPPRA
jgi:dTDP-4-dehydrorhamnose reductase